MKIEQLGAGERKILKAITDWGAEGDSYLFQRSNNLTDSLLPKTGNNECHKEME